MDVRRQDTELDKKDREKMRRCAKEAGRYNVFSWQLLIPHKHARTHTATHMGEHYQYCFLLWWLSWWCAPITQPRAANVRSLQRRKVEMLHCSQHYWSNLSWLHMCTSCVYIPVSAGCSHFPLPFLHLVNVCLSTCGTSECKKGVYEIGLIYLGCSGGWEKC